MGIYFSSMSPQKTKALILRVLPFRETSCILHLFTEHHGLVHGIAKGVRGKKNSQDFIERGFLVECIVYNKPQRDLHTLGTIHVLEYFPAVRSNLIKGALRDAAFETILSAITVSDIHPELYELFLKFMEHLDSSPECVCHPFALWLFFHRFAQHMGFGLDVCQCISCGTRRLTQEAYLAMNRGGFECRECSGSRLEQYLFPPEVLSYLNSGSPKPEKLREICTPDTMKKVTRLLADYSRYHFDTQREMKALAFLDEMAGW